MTGWLAAAGPVIPDSISGGQKNSCVRENHGICWSWIKDNWGDNLWPALTHHVTLVLIAIALGFVVAMALALVAYRWWRWELPISYFTNAIYTIPSIAAFELLVQLPSPFGLNRFAAEVALVSYTLSILFFNIVAGLRNVSPDVRDAAEGMGLTRRQSLLRVELPLALPAIIAGLRIATGNIVALTTITGVISVQSLGTPIFDGIQRNVFKTEIIAAGVLAILLALVADALLVVGQRVLTPWARGRAA